MLRGHSFSDCDDFEHEKEEMTTTTLIEGRKRRRVIIIAREKEMEQISFFQ